MQIKSHSTKIEAHVLHMMLSIQMLTKPFIFIKLQFQEKKKSQTQNNLRRRGGLMKMAVSTISFLVAYFNFLPYI